LGTGTIVIIYIISLILSSYFASCETVFTAVSKVRLRTMADKGNKSAKTALWVCDRFDKTLITLLIGNNVFHMLGATVTAMFLSNVFGDEKAKVLSFPGTIVTALIVYLFAEMIPKSLSKVHNEKLSLFLAPSMKILVQVLTPISALFSAISKLVEKCCASGEKKSVTEEEIISIIETIEDEGVLEPEKQALVSSAMEFREKLAKDIMIPMDQVKCIPSTISQKELVEWVKTSRYSRIPVYEGSKNNIVGILPVNLFLSNIATGKRVPIRKILLKPYVFHYETEISELLQRMRLNKLHMVFLTNDQKEKCGILTMEDLLEELVGDIQDESDAGEGLQLM
jgi:CBS domain containing-hemolysin-like protein